MGDPPPPLPSLLSLPPHPFSLHSIPILFDIVTFRRSAEAHPHYSLLRRENMQSSSRSCWTMAQMSTSENREFVETFVFPFQFDFSLQFVLHFFFDSRLRFGSGTSRRLKPVFGACSRNNFTHFLCFSPDLPIIFPRFLQDG